MKNIRRKPESIVHLEKHAFMRGLSNRYFLFAVSLLSLVLSTNAQNKKKIIQLSGVVLAEDSVSGVPSAHIYVPRTGQGTISDRLGYFSLPVLESDSVVISSIGYETEHYIVPHFKKSRFFAVIVRMKPNLTQLENIEVLPFPTEEAFKSAVLAMNLPANEGVMLNAPSTEELMLLNANNMNSYTNYKYYMEQYEQSVEDGFRARTNPYLNPFSWYYFIRDVMKNKRRKK